MFNPHFDTALAADYKSESQKIHVLSAFQKTALHDKGYLTFKEKGHYSL